MGDFLDEPVASGIARRYAAGAAGDAGLVAARDSI
jgi:hypothetical protein